MGAALGSGSTLRDSLLQARQNKEEELGRQGEVGDKVHFLADRLMRLAPAAGRGLLAAVVNRMPHKRLEKEVGGRKGSLGFHDCRGLGFRVQGVGCRV